MNLILAEVEASVNCQTLRYSDARLGEMVSKWPSFSNDPLRIEEHYPIEITAGSNRYIIISIEIYNRKLDNVDGISTFSHFPHFSHCSIRLIGILVLIENHFYSHLIRIWFAFDSLASCKVYSNLDRAYSYIVSNNCTGEKWRGSE